MSGPVLAHSHAPGSRRSRLYEGCHDHDGDDDDDDDDDDDGGDDDDIVQPLLPLMMGKMGKFCK